MQNIMHATLHKTRDIFTTFVIHNYEGLSNVSLVFIKLSIEYKMPGEAEILALFSALYMRI